MVDDKDDCERIWAKHKVKGSNGKYIRTFHRTPDKSDPEYLQHLHSTVCRIPIDKDAHVARW